jgi:crossover junction endodeoxyribonuclease RusA
MIELTLPYPPSVNHYKNVGRTVITKSGKKYQQKFNSKETVAFYYQIYMLSRSQSSKFIRDWPISVEIDVYPPDKRKRDLDNILKVLLDSMARAGVYHDDVQIARLVIQRCDIIKQGQIIVRIFPHEYVTRASTQETICI